MTKVVKTQKHHVHTGYLSSLDVEKHKKWRSGWVCFDLIINFILKMTS